MINVFLKISENLQENTCIGLSFLIKLQANFLKTGTPTQVFPVNFVAFIGTSFFIEHSQKLIK